LLGFSRGLDRMEATGPPELLVAARGVFQSVSVASARWPPGPAGIV